MVERGKSVSELKMSVRTLFLLRGTWILFLAVGVAVLLLGLPAQIANLASPCYSAPCGQSQLLPGQIQELTHLGLSLSLYAGYMVGLILLGWLVFVSIAAAIFLRKPNDRVAILCSFTLLAWGIGGPATGFIPPDPLLSDAVSFFQVLGNIGIVLFLLLFPDGKFLPRWTRWFAPLAVAREVLNVYFPNDLVNNLFFVSAAIILFVQVYRYRRISNPVQRQQTKWVVFGTTVGVSGYAVVLLSFIIAAPPNQPPGLVPLVAFNTALNLLLLFVPLSIGTAILRSHLWDIDIIIRRTLVYSALTVSLALVYVASVAVLGELARALTGQRQSDFVIVVSTLAIAVLCMPLRRRIQASIDEHFYRRRYDAQQVLTRFASFARDEVDLARLKEELLGVVQDTMQPTHSWLWLRQAESRLKPMDGGGRAE